MDLIYLPKRVENILFYLNFPSCHAEHIVLSGPVCDQGQTHGFIVFLLTSNSLPCQAYANALADAQPQETIAEDFVCECLSAIRDQEGVPECRPFEDQQVTYREMANNCGSNVNCFFKSRIEDSNKNTVFFCT